MVVSEILLPVFLRAVFNVTVLMLPVMVLAQECAVEKESLKGTYTGECKNGKANGKGKAVGSDTYDGQFKSGLPDGQGTYTWANGDSFTGKFVKGLREGKGMMIYKRNNNSDSTVGGFWKKDEYAGKYEKPWIVHFQSKLVTEIGIEVKKGNKQVTFFISNTSGGGSLADGTETVKLKVDEVEMTKGSHGRIFSNTDNSKKTETVIYDVSFPAYMKVTIGSEQVEIEFLEEGNYIINLRINQ